MAEKSRPDYLNEILPNGWESGRKTKRNSEQESLESPMCYCNDKTIIV